MSARDKTIVEMFQRIILTAERGKLAARYSAANSGATNVVTHVREVKRLAVALAESFDLSEGASAVLDRVAEVRKR